MDEANDEDREELEDEEDEECEEASEQGDIEPTSAKESDDAASVEAPKQEEQQPARSSALAEDDGTLYGKEFSLEDTELNEEEKAPLFGDAAMLASQKIVADSMNQKFIPEELRQERANILDTAHIDVIRASKLDLDEAENRIRHREPHLVFELLSKASEIYRHGVLSGHELDALRSMIVGRIQPSRMVSRLCSGASSLVAFSWCFVFLCS